MTRNRAGRIFSNGVQQNAVNLVGIV